MMGENKNLASLPKGWVWTTIREISEKFESGGRPKGGAKNIKGGIVSIGGEHLISSGCFNFSNVRYVPMAFFETMTRGIVREGDILIVKDGATTGKTSIIRKGFPFKQAVVNEHVFLVRPFEETDKLYIFYYLFSSFGQDYVRKNFRGTAQGGIALSFANNTFVPLPPLPEQRRIVAKIEELFTRLDAGVEALNKVKLQLKRYRQSVLKSAFEGKLTAEWREAHKGELEPASVLLEKIKEEQKKSGKYKELPPLDTSKLPGLPEGWIWTRVGDITESMKNGIYKPPEFYINNGIACLRMYNIENGLIVWKDIKRMNLAFEEIEEYELKPNDILVNRVNSRELVGKSAIIPEGLEKCVYESKNIRLRLFQGKAGSRFVNYWFLIYSQQYFNRNTQQTVGMASINQVQLAAMPVPFTSYLEQNHIVEEIERRFSIADEIEKIIEQGLKQAERLRQSILKRAFEGKLVPQNPNDEPAEKLLERIKVERANGAPQLRIKVK